MEVPFNYILINIMINLKNRCLETKISKQNLIKIINIIIYELEITEKEKLKMSRDFDFNYELDIFYNENIEYFEIFQDNIILNNDVFIDELENILDDNKTDEFILDMIDGILQTNISIMELTGIKIRKYLYKWLALSIYEEEKMYVDLLQTRKNNNFLLERNIIKQIKFHCLARKIYFVNLDTLDPNDLYDLSLYGDAIEENIVNEVIPFNIKNNMFDERNIYCTPFQRNLFFDESSTISSASYKLNKDLNKKLGIDSVIYKDDYKFYLNYYYLLCDEINNIPDSKLKCELEKTKYKLMATIDCIFDNTLFMGIDNSNLNNYESKYRSNELEAYFFIDEILSYNDNMYKYKESYVLEYFNVVKKIFIKTYYLLTKNENIIDKIKQNKLYNINKYSTMYFNDILNNSKRRIK